MAHQRIALQILLIALATSDSLAADKASMRTRSLSVTSRSEQPMPPGFETWAKQTGDLLKITISSSRNVREAVNSNEAHVAFNAWFCNDEREVPLYMPYVYDSSGLLGEDRTIPAGANTDVTVYIALSADARSTSEPMKRSVPAYDLKTNPRDICIRINAINMAARGFRSQVVHVTAREIATATSKI
jgi:hypothetical protein